MYGLQRQIHIKNLCPSSSWPHHSKGLQLKIQPCVPKSPCRELASRLQKEWARNIRQTSRDFLTALKLYHRGCAYHLRCQASNLETSIKAQFRKMRIRLLEKEVEAAYVKWDSYLRKRHHIKLNKLHSSNSRINE